jgi:uncharacterized protein YecE (DUF72 family)
VKLAKRSKRTQWREDLKEEEMDAFLDSILDALGLDSDTVYRLCGGWNKQIALRLVDAALLEEREKCAKAYRARLDLALAQLPEKHKRDPNEASYAEAIEDMIDMLGVDKEKS